LPLFRSLQLGDGQCPWQIVDHQTAAVARNRALRSAKCPSQVSCSLECSETELAGPLHPGAMSGGVTTPLCPHLHSGCHYQSSTPQHFASVGLARERVPARPEKPLSLDWVWDTQLIHPFLQNRRLGRQPWSSESQTQGQREESKDEPPRTCGLLPADAAR